MLEAMSELGFGQSEVDSLLGIVAAIIHLGEVDFSPAGDGSQVNDSKGGLAQFCKVTSTFSSIF